jgi:D-glycero-D-manno-heptose 1,7-bisphosphate phosphatase
VGIGPHAGAGPLTGARRAVFLDRDGVLNETTVVEGRPLPPATVDEFRLLPGVIEACTRLRDAGLVLVVVTNQPDIARGTQDPAVVGAMHARLRELVPLDAVLVCAHDDADGCDCRKPKPGLLLRAAATLDVDLTRSVMVGDRWRDVEAGAAGGCRTVFVDRGYAERRPENPDLTVRNLGEAVPWILLQTA